jgi:hypothetical protein
LMKSRGIQHGSQKNCKILVKALDAASKVRRAYYNTKPKATCTGHKS